MSSSSFAVDGAAENTLVAQHTTSDGTLVVLPGAHLILFKGAGDRHFEMRFSIGSCRYAGSTGCEETDLAIMVAKTTYATILAELGEGKALSSPQAA
nr:hypothetical protein [Methylobacterium sp. L1A1]